MFEALAHRIEDFKFYRLIGEQKTNPIRAVSASPQTQRKIRNDSMEAVENDRMRKVGNKISARNGPLIVINANFERRDVGLVEKSATENTRLETTG